MLPIQSHFLRLTETVLTVYFGRFFFIVVALINEKKLVLLNIILPPLINSQGTRADFYNVASQPDGNLSKLQHQFKSTLYSVDLRASRSLIYASINAYVWMQIILTQIVHA